MTPKIFFLAYALSFISMVFCLEILLIFSVFALIHNLNICFLSIAYSNVNLSMSKIQQYKNVQPPRPFIWIWNSSCSNKIRVFSWLVLMDRLNVRNILRRNCVLCPNNREETTFHLFSCPFSQACWSSLNIHWNYTTDFYSMMDESRSQFPHKFFMEVFIIAA
jgi:hypothetical protein